MIFRFDGRERAAIPYGPMACAFICRIFVHHRISTHFEEIHVDRTA
jgi:hypothetical protein